MNFVRLSVPSCDTSDQRQDTMEFHKRIYSRDSETKSMLNVTNENNKNDSCIGINPLCARMSVIYATQFEPSVYLPFLGKQIPWPFERQPE